MQIFEEQLVLSLDEDEDDGDVIDYSSSVSGESFHFICTRMLQLSEAFNPADRFISLASAAAIYQSRSLFLTSVVLASIIGWEGRSTRPDALLSAGCQILLWLLFFVFFVFFCSVMNRQLCSLHDEAVIHKNTHTRKQQEHVCGCAKEQGV